tara:strand:- start:513 stop:1877 length:1365 start_codon:yes stop_codon:yes gene_type:complete
MQINSILNGRIGESVSVSGWIMTCRKQKNLSFIKCNDGTCPQGIQLILEDVDHDSSLLQTGASITASGVLVESPAKGQKVEVKVETIEVIGKTNPDEYPLAKTRMGLDTLRTFIHLRPRTGAFGSIFRIKSAITHGTHQFFHQENYLHLDPNVITINECEGGAGVFQVTENDLTDINKLPNKEGKYDWSKDHFNKPVFLTVSSQLQLEALSCALGAVYTTNKSFRSEHSSTNKHVSEFTHLEIEHIFIDMEYLMNIGERYIKYLAKYILENCLQDVENLNKFASRGILDRINTIKDAEFHRIKHKDAIDLLQTSDLEEKPQHGEDLSSEAENWLTEYFKGPVFVTHWPIEIKSFYMKQCDDGTCESFDLLMPYKIGELIGGSMREENYDKLMSMMKKKNIDETKLKFYTDLRKFGTVPHGGFGLGIDRLCMMFTGMENIKDVIPFPVQYKNCEL